MNAEFEEIYIEVQMRVRIRRYTQTQNSNEAPNSEENNGFPNFYQEENFHEPFRGNFLTNQNAQAALELGAPNNQEINPPNLIDGPQIQEEINPDLMVNPEPGNFENENFGNPFVPFEPEHDPDQPDGLQSPLEQSRAQHRQRLQTSAAQSTRLKYRNVAQNSFCQFLFQL